MINNRICLKTVIAKPAKPVPVKYMPINGSRGKTEAKATVEDCKMVAKRPWKKAKQSYTGKPGPSPGKALAIKGTKRRTTDYVITLNKWITSK